MNRQTGVNFGGVVAAIALTGLLACQAWRQRVGSSL
jgi:hypothetical protein